MSVLENVELARSHNNNIPKLKKTRLKWTNVCHRAGIEILQREMEIQDTKLKDCLIILEYT